MLTAILITLIVTVSLAYALRSPSSIARRPYNNRYSDAAGAREDNLA
jgi:hypothetical protein